MFQSTLLLVILIRMFLRFIFFVILEYNTTLRYENVNKNIRRLFVCVSVTLLKSLSRVCQLDQLDLRPIGFRKSEISTISESILDFSL